MEFIHGRYRNLRDALLKDEVALLTVFERTAAKVSLPRRRREAGQVLEDALGKIPETGP
jgi:hypothetical protein